MNRGWLYIFVSITVSLSPVASRAQISVRAAATRNTILIGEPLSLTVDAYVPLGSPVIWFPPDSIDHFLVTARSAVDTSNGIDGKKISQTLTLTSFDSGHWAIPPFQVTVAGKPAYSDSVGIDVGFAEYNASDDYRDIKDIISAAPTSSSVIPWIIAGVALAAIVAMYFLWYRNRKTGPAAATAPVSRLSPYEKAMRDLSALKKRGSAGNEKGFYSELNDVFRLYLSEKFRVSTFERTNEELILQLSSLSLPRKSFSSLSQSLRISDFVKFAKYRPAENDNLANLEAVRASIDLLNEQPSRAV